MHKSVLIDEVVEGLDITSDDIVLDGTLGGGGHSAAICKRLGRSGILLGLDEDQDAIQRSHELLDDLMCQPILILSNFRNLDTVADQHNVSHVTKIIFDLGLSSFQLEESGRGFSFQKDEPLSMTFKKEAGDSIQAQDLINIADEKQLKTILLNYGEEQYAGRIARAIVKARVRAPIQSTSQLVEVIMLATPKAYHNRKTHPATKTFQALRIAVNDEIGALEEGLQKGFERLSSGGRFAVISFHSIEDRIVKNFFRDKEKEDVAKRLTKKPITPSEKELEENPRSRSAKLRILERV